MILEPGDRRARSDALHWLFHMESSQIRPAKNEDSEKKSVVELASWSDIVIEAP